MGIKFIFYLIILKYALQYMYMEISIKGKVKSIEQSSDCNDQIPLFKITVEDVTVTEGGVSIADGVLCIMHNTPHSMAEINMLYDIGCQIECTGTFDKDTLTLTSTRLRRID